MAINILAIRNGGDNPGPDIIDALCTTEEIAISRGTQFIDANHKNRLFTAITGPFRQWMSPGNLVEVVDSEFSNYKALLNAITISIDKNESTFTANVILKLERISDE